MSQQEDAAQASGVDHPSPQAGHDAGGSPEPPPQRAEFGERIGHPHVGQRRQRAQQRLALQPAAKPEFGDLQLAACLQLAKPLGKKPRDLATQVLEFVAGVRGAYRDVVLLGIGGSALGPIALRNALRPPQWPCRPCRAWPTAWNAFARP